MRPPLFGKVAILGTGLIGASLSAALMRSGAALHIAVHDANWDESYYVLRQGFAHASLTTASEAAADAEIVVLATPASQAEAVIKLIAGTLRQGVIITDVCSTKRSVISAIRQHLPETAVYVPGHPIAGNEKSGAAALNPELFQERKVILTPDEAEVLSEPVARVRNLWEAVGAQVEYMPADIHDKIYAYVSHLPQIIAYAAYPIIGDAVGGCDGVNRLSKSPAKLWAEICLYNADYIKEAIDEFSMLLGQMHMELSESSDGVTTTPDADEEGQAKLLLCAVSSLCLVATALLLEQRIGVKISGYGGSGFKSMTEAAGHHSDSVLSSISDNPVLVSRLMQRLLDRINIIASALTNGSKEKLVHEFSVKDA